MDLSGKVRHWLARARAWSRVERLAGEVGAFVAFGLLVWGARLWPEWRANPDLSHGFFALPVVFLLWRRALEDAAAKPARGLPTSAQAALVGFLGPSMLVAAFFATVYSIAMGWSSAPVLFLLSFAAASATALAGTLAAGRGVRWIQPGWPALVIPAVILLSAPLPPATYQRLTVSLQEFITGGVVETLRIFGVPAMRAGNVIHLGATSVGVEEACSGVRSLVSCVLAGLVLSALMLRSPRRRAALVLLAAPLALLTNFCRSLALTLLARGGVDIAGAWHDGLGFAVLGVTTALLAWLATVLEAREAASAGKMPSESSDASAKREPNATLAAEAPSRRGNWVPGAGALACVALALLWLGYVASRTESRAELSGPVPDLARIVPAQAPEGWEVQTRQDLLYYADALRTDHLLERSYQRHGPDGLIQVTVYVAWWAPGQASVSAVAAHTPESCWPGSGWVMDGGQSARLVLPLPDGRRVAEAEQRVFRHDDFPQRVWFWHLVAGEPFRAFDPLSWRDQLKMFFEHGVRGDEAQAFVRISTNREWSEIAGEPLVAEIVKGFAELGVPVRATAADTESSLR